MRKGQKFSTLIGEPAGRVFEVLEDWPGGRQRYLIIDKDGDLHILVDSEVPFISAVEYYFTWEV